MSTPRVILITGASGGIGRACAIGLSNTFPTAGDDRPLVLILSGRREAELQATANETREGTTTEIVVGDVSKEEDVESMFKLVKEKYGRVDVVFNVGHPRSVQAGRYADEAERWCGPAQGIRAGRLGHDKVPTGDGRQRHVCRSGAWRPELLRSAGIGVDASVRKRPSRS